MSKNNKINAVVFDLWETIGAKNISVSKTLLKHFGLNPTHDFLQRYEKAIQLKKWDTKDDAAKSLLTEFDIELSQANCTFAVDLLSSSISKATMYRGMKELLVDLKYKVKLGLLSNTTNFESVALTNWGIDQLFTAKVFSWEIGTIKPSANNFKVICEKLNLPPHEILFVDDGIVNVDAAKSFGMQGKLFSGIEDLVDFLNKD